MVLRNLACAAASLLLMCIMFAPQAQAGQNISPREAFHRADKGEILLVDIRSRKEWRATGVATVAATISMHEDGFFDKLDKAVGGDHSRAVALICAMGGRSLFMQAQLIGRGYTNVLAVQEGMVGGRYGPGWIKTGLPTKPFSED